MKNSIKYNFKVIKWQEKIKLEENVGKDSGKLVS
jgi:hypothetical protein